MISVYTGTPGSGKSLHAAERIYYRIRRGDPVICNFNVVFPDRFKHKDMFVYRDNQELTPDYLIDYARCYWGDGRVREGKLLLMIDEAQLLFDCRSWKGYQRAAWTSFFTQHRKFGYDIVLMCQFIGMLDKQLRSIVEYEYIHRKVAAMGWRGWFLQTLLLSPNLFVAVKIWSPLGERLGADFFKYHKRYAKMYDTYTEFKAPLTKKEQNALVNDNIIALTDTGWGT